MENQKEALPSLPNREELPTPSNLENLELARIESIREEAERRAAEVLSVVGDPADIHYS